MTAFPTLSPHSTDLGLRTAASQAHHLLAYNDRFHRSFEPGIWKYPLPDQFGRACQRAKWALGYYKRDCTPTFGPKLHGFLVPLDWAAAVRLPLGYRTRRLSRLGHPTPFPEPDPERYPLAVHGQIIGVPYVGTHLLYGNWESDNAIDIAVDTGTPVLAYAAGTIGSQIGPLQTGGDPRLLGLRLHLVTPDQEFYYAHLSHLDVVAGQHVQAGQRLGLSGSANGVEHLHWATEHGDPGALIGHPTPGYSDRHYPG